MNPIYMFSLTTEEANFPSLVNFRSLCNFDSLSDVLLRAKEQGLMLFKPSVCVCVCVCVLIQNNEFLKLSNTLNVSFIL